MLAIRAARLFDGVADQLRPRPWCCAAGPSGPWWRRTGRRRRPQPGGAARSDRVAGRCRRSG